MRRGSLHHGTSLLLLHQKKNPEFGDGQWTENVLRDEEGPNRLDGGPNRQVEEHRTQQYPAEWAVLSRSADFPIYLLGYSEELNAICSGTKGIEFVIKDMGEHVEKWKKSQLSGATLEDYDERGGQTG